MFNRFIRFYNSIKLVADAAVLSLAFGLAYWTRFHTSLTHESIPPFDDTLVSLAMVLVIFPFAFRQSNLYTTNRNRSHVGEVFAVFRATVFATLILVGVTYFTRERYSRLTIGIFVAYAFVGVSLLRLLFRIVFNGLRRRGFNQKTILVVGAGELGIRVLETIHAHRELGFVVKGLLTRRPEKVGTTINGVKVLGMFDALSRVLDADPVDQVILALPFEDQPLVKPLMEELATRTVDVKVVPDLFQYMTLRGGLEDFGGLPIISLQGAPLEGWNLILKRAFDVAVSLLALLSFAPVMAAVAIAIKLSSKGSVLFRQARMGIDGHTFMMFKFRTMRDGAETQGAPQMATPDDPRKTSLGAFLRRFSIDELPQFLNVFLGDMSLVGPRPERPVFIEEFKKQIPRYHLRHMVKSGITGWAQVNGLRGQTSIEKRIEFDLYYIENWSLSLDMKILLRTAFGGFLSKNAY